jgi:hypothetical protein
MTGGGSDRHRADRERIVLAADSGMPPRASRLRMSRLSSAITPLIAASAQALDRRVRAVDLDPAGVGPVDRGQRLGEDLEFARRRQTALVLRGERLVIDGLVGPASLAASRRHGFARWRDVPGSP